VRGVHAQGSCVVCVCVCVCVCECSGLSGQLWVLAVTRYMCVCGVCVVCVCVCVCVCVSSLPVHGVHAQRSDLGKGSWVWCVCVCVACLCV